MTDARKAPAREAILAAHRFPGHYEIKAFGPAGDSFRDAVLAHAHAVAGETRVTVSERATRSGDRVCVSVTVFVERVEQVEEVYDRLYTLPELLLIM
jgi:putative lipoic acid-binding regulatory protein